MRAAAIATENTNMTPALVQVAAGKLASLRGSAGFAGGAWRVHGVVPARSRHAAAATAA